MNKLIVKLAVAIAFVGLASPASAQQINCANVLTQIERARQLWNANNCNGRPHTFACLNARSQIQNYTALYRAYCTGVNRPALVDEDGFKID